MRSGFNAFSEVEKSEIAKKIEIGGVIGRDEKLKTRQWSATRHSKQDAKKKFVSLGREQLPYIQNPKMRRLSWAVKQRLKLFRPLVG